MVDEVGRGSMTKRCSFCDYESADETAFAEHMRTVHNWDQLGSPSAPKAGTPSAVAFVAGAGLALAFNFVLAFATFSGRPGLGIIVAAWLVTIGGFALLYRLHHWAAYGALGLYAALFFVLLFAGGASAAYTCFSAYGYPSPR
jgi:hypothetical protein